MCNNNDMQQRITVSEIASVVIVFVICWLLNIWIVHHRWRPIINMRANVSLSPWNYCSTAYQYKLFNTKTTLFMKRIRLCVNSQSLVLAAGQPHFRSGCSAISAINVRVISFYSCYLHYFIGPWNHENLKGFASMHCPFQSICLGV